MKLEKAVARFLEVIEAEAQSSYKTWINKKWVWNEGIWEENDPVIFKHVQRIRKLLAEGAGHD